MRGVCRNFGYLFVLIVLFVLCQAGLARAAQSTADVVADSAMKEKLRQEIVGTELQYPGEEEEYVIGYGDILSVSVYGEGDMAASLAHAAGRGEGEGAGGDALRRPGTGVEVRIDGRISLQHIGDVNVVGMTLTQLADYLKKLYSTVFTDPIVTVTLVQSNSRRYTVMGQVANPGIFFLDYPITLVQAVARSGGFTEWANHEITVVRQGDGLHKGKGQQKKKLEFDYDDFLKGKDLEKNIYIHSGDIVIVH
ncbi:hypothetical protein GF1_00310 [Desulfolithobacter dissulfuricans]|uniref:Soluble ligand binding domain-containing protein n=1 Tax=Desulfolithobacter dissulfuricans TaxID=2795293 RepID=A0A915U8T0_9BACT|nr:polysaccharide biosynthesis/export family protein [Desulfolithobacter dissulfuricans]BCO07655.1 hypothetical protein GF1_00310 [Desulfolithobacter dissulfuricans]